MRSRAGRQVRCVHVTRNAGAIWGDTYREVLDKLVSKAVVLRHVSSIMLRETSRQLFLGTISLHLHPTRVWIGSKKHFENNFNLKMRGRLGVGVEGKNKLMILNKIVRMTSTGLEHDPNQA